MGGLKFRVNGWVSALLVVVAVSGCSASHHPKRPASQSYAAGGESGHAPIRSGDDGDGIASDTGMLVLSGDQVTIQPLLITREERAQISPVVTRLDNEVCIQKLDVCARTVPVMERQCRDSCGLCSKCIIDFIGLGCRESVCCTKTCQDVHTGDQCVVWNKQCLKKENHWTETSLFAGLGSSTTAEDPAPMKSADALLTGVKLRFSYSDANGLLKQMDCALGMFKPQVSNDAFTFQLHDVPGCPSLFADQPETPRSLGLINGLSESMSYLEGVLVKSWDKRILEQPHTISYHPRVDLSLTVSVQSPSSSAGPNVSRDRGPRGM